MMAMVRRSTKYRPRMLESIPANVVAACAPLLRSARNDGGYFRAAKCAHLGASAQGRLRGPSDRHHAARRRDSKSQEAAQRDLHEAYWPAAAEDRRGAGPASLC